MKRYIHILIGVLTVFGVFFTSCEDMENEPLEIQSDIYVWDEDDYTGENAKQWLNFIYSFIPAGMDRFNGQPMEVLTDDAIPTDRANANWSVINSGYSTTNMFPLEHRKADTYGESWTLLYKAIRYCNIFLQNYEKVPWSDWEEASYHANEARALRAYFYWLLVRTYGGVPLIYDKVFTMDSPELRTLQRNSFAECVQYIKDEIDAVKDNLRLYSDIGERKSPDEKKNSFAEGIDSNWKHVRKWGLLGLEARMLLYAASPLVNGTGNAAEPWLGYPENDPNRWKEAADICRTIINTNQFILEKDRTRLSRTTINGEVLWMKKGQDGNALYADNWGYKNSPMSFKDMGTWAGNGRPCRGQTSPTQELVDAFPMKNGKSIDEAKESGEYNPQDPYKNRDPRLTQTVFYHNSRWLRANVDVSEGGKDNNSIEPTQEATRTKTGYYLKRHLAENEEDTQFGKTNFHSSIVSSWPVVRYADILLMNAEALAELGELDKTAWDATIKPIRDRAGFTLASALEFPEGASKDKLIEIVRNERRSELALEGHRHKDIIRWRIADNVLNGWCHGLKTNDVVGTDDGYVRVENRTFNANKHYLWPIPQAERDLNGNLEQNPNW